MTLRMPPSVRVGTYLDDRSPKVSLAYGAALAAIVACAVFVAAYWAVRVPLFQEPDEVAHADYAFAFFDSGQVFGLRNAIPTNYVTPQVRYLMKASEYRRIRYNAYGRVSPEYGSTAWRERVDRDAPPPSNRPPSPGSRVPYVMSLYPEPYYVAVAAVMSAAWHLTNHSLISAFISGRFLGVSFLAATLTLSLLVLSELHFTRIQRLLVLLAVGFLPLTTSIASAIQPDNQSALLVVLCWLLALKIRKSPASVRLIGLLVLAETALAFTKVHYASIVSLSIAIALRDVYRGRAKMSFVALLVTAPTIGILASLRSLPIDWSGIPHPKSDLHRFDVLHSAQLAMTNLLRLLHDSFGGGSIFDSFWFHFGVRAGRVFSGEMLHAFTVALIIGTFAAAIALGVTQMAILRRMVQIAKSRGIASAARFVGKDLATDLYVTVTCFLFGVSVFTGGSVPLQGRYWYPMLVPLIVVTVTAFSNLAARRNRKSVMTVACFAWAAYAIIASPSATVAMERDFYVASADKRTTELGELTRATLDGVVIERSGPARARSTDILELEGVSLDATRGSASEDVRYSIDRGPLRRARVGERNPELAEIFGDPALQNAGFSITLNLRGLGAGAHTVRIVTLERGIPRALSITEFHLKLDPS